MSGHSKWSTIKRKKGKTDQERGKIFSKIAREITSAVKQGGGGDPAMNPRLRLVMEKAKSANMPNDNIERAIAKGVGGGDGVELEEITYEGYGASGVAVMVEIMTDNRNRTAAEIRHIFAKHGGNLGESGCVAWQFKKQGLITIDKEGQDEEKIVSAAIEAGAEDINSEDDVVEIITTPSDFETVLEGIKKEGFKPSNAEITLIPQNLIKLEKEAAEKVIRLMTALEDHDDVQSVAANIDLEDDLVT